MLHPDQFWLAADADGALAAFLPGPIGPWPVRGAPPPFPEIDARDEIWQLRLRGPVGWRAPRAAGGFAEGAARRGLHVYAWTDGVGFALIARPSDPLRCPPESIAFSTFDAERILPSGAFERPHFGLADFPFGIALP